MILDLNADMVWCYHKPSHQEGHMNRRAIGYALLILLFASGVVSAQSYSGDARAIALGGIGNVDNIATKMIDDERDYSSYPIPLGLFQLLSDLDRFDPDDKEKFDPILAMEYAANPLHYVFGRDPGGSRGKFISDIINGDFSTDLNNYRGFVPTNSLLAEGLANPSWGKTFKLYKGQGGSFQGFYAGVGPYLSARNDLNIDTGLTDLLASATDVYLPDKHFMITDATAGQLALDVTLGYRARFPLPGKNEDGKSKRNGIYVGMNYHILKGFAYESPDIEVRFDTDPAGLLIINPTTSPVVVDYRHSHSGSGFALDLGVGTVVDEWEFGFGANGVGNRINWDEMIYKQFKMESLFEGGDFVEERLPIDPELTVKLPVEYIWNIGYHHKAMSAAVEVSHGFQGSSFHGGVEYRLLNLEFRGGLRYGLDRWHPSCGVGFNVTKRFSIDWALFSSTTNIERKHKTAMALSLRFNHPTI